MSIKTILSQSLHFAIVLGAASQLPAASFVVTDLADAGPGTLRQAILNANATEGDDTISFAIKGTITLVTQLPAITGNTGILGPGTNLLTVSGNNQVRVFTMNAGTTNSLSDLTIAEGFTMSQLVPGPGPDTRTNAAGIANAGWLVMQRCVVRDCRAGWSLGASIYNIGKLEIEDSTISGARTSHPSRQDAEVRGGGLYNGGTVRMVNCLITNCAAGNWGAVGGAIYNSANSQLFAQNTRIQNCFSSGPYGDGGGVVNRGSIVFENSLIADCNGFWGGGIYHASGGLIMTNTTVRNCRARAGGGILLRGTGLLVGCTISSNGWSMGAGILNAGVLTLDGCHVSRNYNDGMDAPNFAGSVMANYNNGHFPAVSGATYLNRCTIISNSGPAEIAMRGVFKASNSIIGSLERTNNPVRPGTHTLLSNNPDTDQTGANGLIID